MFMSAAWHAQREFDKSVKLGRIQPSSPGLRGMPMKQSEAVNTDFLPQNGVGQRDH
jgi:hypothetical protein